MDKIVRVLEGAGVVRRESVLFQSGSSPGLGDHEAIAVCRSIYETRFDSMTLTASQ